MARKSAKDSCNLLQPSALQKVPLESGESIIKPLG
jgi:hypothetical protein